jgi:hypothetical protein
MSQRNSWNVSYATIKFFERALNGHEKVIAFERLDDIRFVIQHASGKSLDVLVVNEYGLGLAAVLRAKAEFPSIDYVVTGGNWNGYTWEAREYGLKNKIGIFKAGEFFGALNMDDPKTYTVKKRT